MSFATRLALFCAAALILLGTANGAGTARLLDRMRAASGPVWRTHLASISELTVDGEATVLQSDDDGLRFVSQTCDGALCSGTYFDGTRLYSIDMNGTTLPRNDSVQSYLRGIRTISSLAFLAPDFTENGGRVADAGDASIDGARYHLLMVSNTDAVPMEVFVDPATFLIRYIRDIDGDGTFEYRDYRRTDGGLMLPMLVLRDGSVLERYRQREIANGAFAVPHGLEVTFAGPSLAIATDPEKSVPVFACTIAGVAARCLLDTGNSGLSISLELAERLGAPSVGSYTVAGLGTYATSIVRTGPLTIGNATFAPADYVVLHDIDRYGYDVVLGADVLAATNIEIDPHAHLLFLRASAPTDSIAIPLAFDDFVPVVQVGLGPFQAHLAVDTGDESNINLSYDFYQQHPSIFRATEQRSVSGVGGSSVELIGRIPNVTLGSYQATDQSIGTTESLRGTALGHLGAQFLSQFTIVLDYQTGILNLVPEAAPAPAASSQPPPP